MVACAQQIGYKTNQELPLWKVNAGEKSVYELPEIMDDDNDQVDVKIGNSSGQEMEENDFLLVLN